MASGDERFDALLSGVMQRAYVGAYRILGNHDSASDALQEAATRALAARHQYDRARPFYPWFYRILKNHCYDRLKRDRREPLGTENGVQDSVREQRPSAEQAVIRTEYERAVHRAISSLPDDLREIIELRHFQDLSYEQIAEVLECPMGSVMSRLYRARKKLRDFLIAQKKV